MRAILFAAVFISAITPGQPAHAYLDPGTGSVLLQLILGGVAGAAVVLKLYWQRFVSIFRSAQPTEEQSQQPDE